MNRPEIVIFDMAGTTVRDTDFVHNALNQALARHGINIGEEDTLEVMGLPKPVALEILMKKALKSHEITGELIRRVHQDFVQIMTDFFRTSAEVAEEDGVREIFNLLKKNRIRIAIDTGFSRDIADTIIRRLGWDIAGLIDFSVTSDEVERGRPHTDMLEAIMRYFNISDPEQVAKVGDAPSDMIMGSRAGCGYVVGVTTGAFNREQLQAFPHTHIIDRLHELKGIFEL